MLVLQLQNEPNELESLAPDQVSLVSDQRFSWKGRGKLHARRGPHKQAPGYQVSACVQLDPPAAATSTDLRSDWSLFAVGTSYGFLLYDYASKRTIINRCTLNVQDFAIVSGDAGAGAMSRKKSFRKSLRESFRRLRRGRSQRQTALPTNTDSATGGSSSIASSAAPASTHQRPAFSRGATAMGGLRSFGGATSAASLADTAQQAAAAHRNLCSGERQVEFKNELSSIVKCITLTSAIITSNASLFKPSLWVGTNSGSVLVYAIDLAPSNSEVKCGEAASENPVAAASADSEQQQPVAGENNNVTITTSARLSKEIQLKHKAPIIAIFTSPEAPAKATTVNSPAEPSAKSTPEKNASELFAASSTSADRKSSPINADSEQQQQQNDRPTSSPTPTPTMADKSPSKSSGANSKQDQQQQARVLICSEEQFKVFNLPSMKPFCKFKLTAHEGLRAKKISITQFMKPAAATGAQSNSGIARAQLATSSSTTLNTSKSLQSFATQTSPAASPVPPAADSSDEQANGEQQQANGSNRKQHNEESNNNSLSALNNNSTTTATSTTTNAKQDKELLNAKFGVKTNSITSSSDKHQQQTLNNQEQEQQVVISGEPVFEPYMVCMSNQGDCAIYSVPDLKRQAQIQVCKREDVNGIMSAMLTNYGEGYYLRSSTNFLRFSISSQRVPRVLSVV